MKFFLGLVAFALVASTIQAVPWIAEPRPDQWWVDRHESFKLNTAVNKDNINVIFYGDSITEGWGGAGNQVFQELYAPLGTANYGIGGDQTQHLLYRIADSEVTDLKPKLVVLKIGTNNGGDPVEDVGTGIIAVVDLLLQRLPTAKVLLLGVLPRNDANWFVRVASINIMISKYADNERVFFLDMFNQFSSSWGQVDMALFNGDQLHLEAPGYRMWADTMGNLLNRLLE